MPCLCRAMINDITQRIHSKAFGRKRGMIGNGMAQGTGRIRAFIGASYEK